MSIPQTFPTLTAQIARGIAGIWRFQGLQLARAMLPDREAPLVLDRGFCGHRLFLDVTRTDTHRLLYLEGERFIDERHLLRDLVEPGMTVVDVGANIGYYMLLFRELVGAEGEVICFEPSPANLKELKKNQKRNGFGNVSIIEKGVGDENNTFSINDGMNATINIRE